MVGKYRMFRSRSALREALQNSLWSVRQLTLRTLNSPDDRHVCGANKLREEEVEVSRTLTFDRLAPTGGRAAVSILGGTNQDSAEGFLLASLAHLRSKTRETALWGRTGERPS
jgi:hypothetical protein